MSTIRVKVTMVITLAILVYVFTSCNNNKAKSTTAVRPHATAASDTYCEYHIDSVVNPKKVTCLKKGDTVCILCGANQHNCDLNKTWIEIYTLGTPESTGVQYLLDNSAVSCTVCTSNQKFEGFTP